MKTIPSSWWPAVVLVAACFLACGGANVRETPDAAVTSGGAAGSGGAVGTSQTSSTAVTGVASTSTASSSVSTTTSGAGGQGGAGAMPGPTCARTMSAQCAMNPTGSLSEPTLDAFRAAILGRWSLCGTESPFGKDKGDVGLEILDDGRWFKLFPAVGAAIVRGAGFNEEGTWDALQIGTDAPYFQLNLHIFGSGTVSSIPALASNPLALRIDNNRVFQGNYVLDPSVPTGTSRCSDSTTELDAGQGTCAGPMSMLCTANPNGPVSSPTLDAFRAAILGRWVLCGTESPFGNGKGDVGLEILSDGRWFRLYPASGGGVVRGAGFDEEGTWDAMLLYGSPPENPGYQLNLNIFGSGTVISSPALASNPPALRINNNGVFQGNYVLDSSVPTGSARCR